MLKCVWNASVAVLIELKVETIITNAEFYETIVLVAVIIHRPKQQLWPRLRSWRG